MTLENVKLEKKNQIAYVTIDRPKVLNALNMATSRSCGRYSAN
jgi:enoyl-CoA hydratase/carnithine racemase